MRGTFPRILDLGSGRDSGRVVGSYQEDAMQEFSYQETNQIDQMFSGSIADIKTEGNFSATGVFSDGGAYGTSGGGGTGYNRTINFLLRVYHQWTNTITNKGKGANTAGETRSKNVAVARFQKIRSIDWRTVPALPKKF